MWAPGGPPGPAGWDRRRVGARLRAALAGLHELQGLRATQQARVRGALAMQPSPEPAAPCGPRAPELRLEAALAALQEQLSRLRRQDAGLKTHLDQLGQQISELQLDVCRSSCEAPDSDSRPSSGFYELSDGGSCSLSTSCASVCSDRSLCSLLPAFQASKDRPAMGDWRPRSADETTVPAWRPQPTEEGRGPPSSAEDPVWPKGMFRPRPVSTGDLERVLPEDVGLQDVCGDRTAAPHLCQGVEGLPHVLDPKYQRDLVSRGGREVYPYPSPLHAVALQSPLFALTRDTPQTTSHTLPPALPPPSTTRTGPAPEVGLAGTYIDRLLRRHSQRASMRGDVRDQGPPRWAASPSPQKLGHAPQAGSNAGSPSRDSLGQQGPGPHGSPQHPSPLPQEDPRPPDGRVPRETVVDASPRPQTQQPPRALDCSRGPGVSPARRVQERPPVAWGHHVPGPGADSKALPGGMATGHPKPKAVKVRRRASDKGPRPTRPPLPSERPRGAPVAAGLPLKWGPSCRPLGAGLRRKPTPGGAAPGRSCSESTLYPVPFFVPLVVARPDNCRASAQVLFPFQWARKQRRRWQSAVEIAGRGGQHEPRATCARDSESSGDDASGLSAGCFGDAEASGSDAEGGRGRRARAPRAQAVPRQSLQGSPEEDPQVPAGRAAGHDHGVRPASRGAGFLAYPGPGRALSPAVPCAGAHCPQQTAVSATVWTWSSKVLAKITIIVNKRCPGVYFSTVPRLFKDKAGFPARPVGSVPPGFGSQSRVLGAPGSAAGSGLRRGVCGLARVRLQGRAGAPAEMHPWAAGFRVQLTQMESFS